MYVTSKTNTSSIIKHT